jgi:hypothetical protein
MPIPLPTAKASLENIRDRWVTAKTYELAHIDAQRQKQRRQRLNGHVTLGLAVVTGIVAAILPSFPADDFGWAVALPPIGAGATALSKLLEQRIVPQSTIEAHGSCITGLEGLMDELNLAAAHVQEYVLEIRQLQLADVGEDTKRIQDEIAKLHQQAPAEVADRHGDAARKACEATSIHDAILGVTRLLEGTTTPLPAGDLPDDAAGIVAVRAPRRSRR